MAKITLNSLPGGLTIDILVKDRDTGDTAFSGVMEEITTGIYKYDFEELPDTDYIYIATTPGYNDISGTLYRDSSSGATPQEIWEYSKRDLTYYAGGGYVNHGINKYEVETILKKFFKDFKEELEEEKQRELDLLEQEKELNRKLDRARSEITKIELKKAIEGIKGEITTLQETNKLNKLQTKKGLDEILTKFNKQELKEQERIKQEKEIQKQLEDNEKLLQELLEEAENDLIEEHLNEAEDELISEMLEEVEEEMKKELE